MVEAGEKCAREPSPGAITSGSTEGLKQGQESATKSICGLKDASTKGQYRNLTCKVCYRETGKPFHELGWVSV